MEQMGVMSDLCMYDLEDIIWDEFDRNDDHIVPHQNGIEPAFKGDSCKKRRREVIDISLKTADHSTSEYASQGKGDEGFQILKNTRAKMLEKDSWSHTPEGVFPASRDDDTNKEVTSLASHNTRIANRCLKSSKEDTIGSEFCDDGPLICGTCDMVDSNSYCCSLGDISQTDNDLSFYSNYDDVVFSCDSMFGNEDGLSWLTSTNSIEGYEGVLTPEFQFSCLESSLFKDKPEQQEHSSANDSNLDSSFMSCKPTFPASKDGEPEALGDWTFMNGSYPVSESNGEFTPKEEVIFHDNQANQHNESDGKRKDRSLDNVPLHCISNEKIKDTELPSGNSSHQVFTSPDILEQEENLGPDSFGYLETHIPCMISNYSHSSNQVPGSSTSTGIKSKTKGHGSLSAKESSSASNPVSMEIYHDYSFQAPTTMDGKRKNMPRRQGFQPSFSSNPKHVDSLVRTASCDPIPVLNHVHHSQNEVENRSNVKGVGIGMPADLYTSSVPEVSSISSGPSGCEKIEASSFHQLQQVMEQLDISTKLCIRDSLYRLARSAEQRHHYDILNGDSIGDRDSGGALMDEGTDNCNRLMEIETDTNPIDRSIAHLLFHRPTDSSVMPTHYCSSLKSNTKIQGSITSPPVISEKLRSREKTACATDNGD